MRAVARMQGHDNCLIFNRGIPDNASIEMPWLFLFFHIVYIVVYLERYWQKVANSRPQHRNTYSMAKYAFFAVSTTCIAISGTNSIL